MPISFPPVHTALLKIGVDDHHSQFGGPVGEQFLTGILVSPCIGPVSTTSTTYVGVYNQFWYFDLAFPAPTGAKPIGRLLIDMKNDTAGQTTYFRLYNATDGTTLAEVSRTGTAYAFVDSGWFDLPTTAKVIYSQIKVSGGTGSIHNVSIMLIGYEIT